MRIVISAALIAFALAPASARAFCGFYVGSADSKLFNKASQVIMVRDGGKTTITMLNDYKGELTNFALVVPVPVVLQKDDIRVADKAVFDRIDAYSAPRLAEYYDGNPCRPAPPNRAACPNCMMMDRRGESATPGKTLGVEVEARYTVGEYDIVLLSAQQSDGLETWLKQNGYNIPAGASQALQPYIQQNMKFFVARVNLAAQAKSGFAYLRPLQFRFETDRFMLPMRLGMINADGPQDLVLYVLTRRGRVESTNYRTTMLPANKELPTYLKQPGEFAKFYKTMFDRQAELTGKTAVITEYVWDMAWCDPCAADPLSVAELLEAGVTWVSDTGSGKQMRGAQPVVLTRLHIRYTKESFPADLELQETGDRRNFQARYILRHAWSGGILQCWDAIRVYRQYRETVAQREERAMQALAELTGWKIDDIRRRQNPGR
jgi:hypothetical protein